jgi:hypothetical protein
MVSTEPTTVARDWDRRLWLPRVAWYCLGLGLLLIIVGFVWGFTVGTSETTSSTDATLAPLLYPGYAFLAVAPLTLAALIISAISISKERWRRGAGVGALIVSAFLMIPAGSIFLLMITYLVNP